MAFHRSGAEQGSHRHQPGGQCPQVARGADGKGQDERAREEDTPTDVGWLQIVGPHVLEGDVEDTSQVVTPHHRPPFSASIRHVYRRLDHAVEHTVQIQQRRDRSPNRVDGVQFLELALKLLRELTPFLVHPGGSESAPDRFLHLLRIERLDDIVARSQP